MNTIPLVKTLVVGILAFAAPVTAVAILQWDKFEPYLIVNPRETVGYVMAFDRPSG